MTENETATLPSAEDTETQPLLPGVESAPAPKTRKKRKKKASKKANKPREISQTLALGRQALGNTLAPLFARTLSNGRYGSFNEMYDQFVIDHPEYGGLTLQAFKGFCQRLGVVFTRRMDAQPNSPVAAHMPRQGRIFPGNGPITGTGPGVPVGNVGAPVDRGDAVFDNETLPPPMSANPAAVVAAAFEDRRLPGPLVTT